MVGAANTGRHDCRARHHSLAGRRPPPLAEAGGEEDRGAVIDAAQRCMRRRLMVDDPRRQLFLALVDAEDFSFQIRISLLETYKGRESIEGAFPGQTMAEQHCQLHRISGFRHNVAPELGEIEPVRYVVTGLAHLISHVFKPSSDDNLLQRLLPGVHYLNGLAKPGSKVAVQEK